MLFFFRSISESTSLTQSSLEGGEMQEFSLLGKRSGPSPSQTSSSSSSSSTSALTTLATASTVSYDAVTSFVSKTNENLWHYWGYLNDNQKKVVRNHLLAFANEYAADPNRANMMPVHHSNILAKFGRMAAATALASGHPAVDWLPTSMVDTISGWLLTTDGDQEGEQRAQGRRRIEPQYAPGFVPPDNTHYQEAD